MKNNKDFFNVISLGAGKQSTFMLLQALQGKFDFYPDMAVFSDLECEPSFVYYNLNYLIDYCQRKHNFKIHVVKPGNLYNNTLRFVNGEKVRESSPPFFLSNGGVLRRHCTLNYKIRPVKAFFREFRAGRPVRLWLGISLDEMERMSKSRIQYITHYFPLVEKKITLAQILNWFETNDFPMPGKSSCIMCPFHSDSYWKILKKNYPDDFEKACVFDEKVRNFPTTHSKAYLHRSLKPLRKIDFSMPNSLFPELLEECHGLCGL